MNFKEFNIESVEILQGRKGNRNDRKLGEDSDLVIKKKVSEHVNIQ